MILDREENPKEVYEALTEAGIETFVSEVESPNDVPDMLIQLGKRLNLEEKANELAASIQQEMGGIYQQNGPIVLPMIWHEPLMAVSPKKYSGALLETCGFRVPDLDPNGNGYPVVSPEQIICLLYTSPSPRDATLSRMPSSA